MNKPKRSLSQNFLTDSHVKRKIGNLLMNINGRNVLEIGPGRGDLTKVIVSCKPDSITAVEKDDLLAAEFEKNFPGISIVNTDIRHYDIDEEVVISSVPYSISRDIAKLIIQSDADEAYLILQKEFAEKIEQDMIVPVSIYVKTFFDAEILLKIDRAAFFPVPNVDSALLHLKRRTGKYPDMKHYWDYLVHVCQNKRKTFKSAGMGLPGRIMHSDCRTISGLYADKHIHTS